MKNLKIVSLLISVMLTVLGIYLLVWGITGRTGLEGWQTGIKNWSIILGILVLIVGLLTFRFQSRMK